MVSHWSVSDCKSPQVSSTLLSILANLNNAVVWMVSTCPVISKFSSLFTNPLGIVLWVPITFFSVLLKSSDIYISFRFLSFSFCGPPGRQSPLFVRFSFFFLSFFLLSLGLVVWPGFICISESQKTLWVSFSRTDSGLCLYHLILIIIIIFIQHQVYYNRHSI